MMKNDLVWIPASGGSSLLPKFSKGKEDAEAASSQARDEGSQRLQELCDTAQRADADAFRQQLDALKSASKKAKSLPARFKVELVRCKRCATGHLNPSLVTGSGNRVASQSLGK